MGMGKSYEDMVREAKRDYGPGGKYEGMTAGEVATIKRNALRRRYELPGYDQQMKRQQDYYGQFGGSDVRADQKGNIGFLRGLTKGKGSVAMQQAKALTERGIGQQMGVAASANPAQAAMAARLAGQNIAGLQMASSGEALQAGLQERQMAGQALAQATQGARGQDLQAREAAMEQGRLLSGQQQAGAMSAEEMVYQQREADRAARRAKWDRLAGMASAGTGAAATAYGNK